MAAASDTVVNPLHPSVGDKIDPDFARIYNRFQGILDPSMKTRRPGYRLADHQQDQDCAPTRYRTRNTTRTEQDTLSLRMRSKVHAQM